ncbi:MAG: ABC transporter permease [Pseudomonadota bacterium]
MGRALMLLRFDAQSLWRDNFLITVAGITGLLLAAIGLAGQFREVLGVDHLQMWIPYVLILFLISNAGTYGMLFGLVFVEEVETRARAALMVLPMDPVHQALIRTLSVVVWLLVQSVLFAWIVAAGWDAVPFGLFGWCLLAVALAPLGAVFMLTLSTVASNRVEALAMGKFFSGASTPPILLYLIAEDAWYRHLFLILPTTPAVHAFEALRAGEDSIALLWVAAGITYALLLGLLALRRYIRKSYMISA